MGLLKGLLLGDIGDCSSLSNPKATGLPHGPPHLRHHGLAVERGAYGEHVEETPADQPQYNAALCEDTGVTMGEDRKSSKGSLLHVTLPLTEEGPGSRVKNFTQ
ncbi:hypothetical protein CA264_10150 [Pontibacter actiniarum]|uniref:Uncharacterized protein n=1 Tax=Pontibacter actiniarum TaxID=323450 RepID=A0A1X9YSE2_9BACT|nr:hypothetical protein CA264_10150 [Pontibacter actiniarum]